MATGYHGSQSKPALIVVDLQEDFCPPNGSLAVPNGRDIVTIANQLLGLPFALKVATKDWHPTNHVSFASNHVGAAPFISTTVITNPYNASESYESHLWPVHCVQNTPGAEIIPEMNIDEVDHVVEKGQDARVEMYSAFYDPLKSPRVSDSGLAAVIREKGITDVYIVGLAADICVYNTAKDAAAEGFKTFIVEEGVRPVDEDVWKKCKVELAEMGVKIVVMDGDDVKRVASTSVRVAS